MLPAAGLCGISTGLGVVSGILWAMVGCCHALPYSLRTIELSRDLIQLPVEEVVLGELAMCNCIARPPLLYKYCEKRLLICSRVMLLSACLYRLISVASLMRGRASRKCCLHFCAMAALLGLVLPRVPSAYCTQDFIRSVARWYSSAVKPCSMVRFSS